MTEILNENTTVRIHRIRTQSPLGVQPYLADAVALLAAYDQVVRNRAALSETLRTVVDERDAKLVDLQAFIDQIAAERDLAQANLAQMTEYRDHIAHRLEAMTTERDEAVQQREQAVEALADEVARADAMTADRDIGLAANDEYRERNRTLEAECARLTTELAERPDAFDGEQVARLAAMNVAKKILDRRVPMFGTAAPLSVPDLIQVAEFLVEGKFAIPLDSEGIDGSAWFTGQTPTPVTLDDDLIIPRGNFDEPHTSTVAPSDLAEADK